MPSLEPTSPADERPWTDDRRWAGIVLAFVLGLTALRVAALFATPLELYPDEAQYWLWSRHLALGYYSKPPMIAWLIAATTALGGDAEPWVRLSAPLLQGAATVALLATARKLAGVRAGLWTAAVYVLMPGVQLSSGVIATDAPLLLFVSLALWAYAGAWLQARASAGRALGLGLAVGLAFLSKYAALYFGLGLALHAAVDGRARAIWSARTLGWAALGFGVAVGPNLAWNLTHGLETVRHTLSDADLSGDGRRAALLHPRGVVGFVVGQFGVFGPIPFSLLLFAAWRALRREPGEALERGLLALTAPALAIVLVEAAVARANANWAACSYPPAAVLVGVVIARRPFGRWAGAATAASQGALAALVIAGAFHPPWIDALGAGNALKRARGWSALERVIEAEVGRMRGAGPVSAVAVDDRFAFNALAYYGRRYWGRPGAPPLRMWVRFGRPRNQAETDAPLTAADGGRVLIAGLVSDYAPEVRADFSRHEERGRLAIPLDPERVRRVSLFEGRGFRPGPRDLSGRPTPP